MHIKPIIVLLCALLLIAPAFAQTQTIEAPEGQAIRFITIGSDEDTTGTLALKLEDGSTIDCTWSYLSTMEIGGVSLVRVGNVSIEGETASTTYRTPGKFYTKFMQTKAMLNASDNTIRIAYGQIDGLWYNYVEYNSPASHIVSATFTADKQVTYSVEYWAVDKARENVQGGFFKQISEIMNFAIETFWDVFDFLTAVYDWTIFFFVTNYQMILALFLAVPMAFAAKNSRGNPERFLRQYFRTLKGFFMFMIDIWRVLIESIGTVRGWFRI